MGNQQPSYFGNRVEGSETTKRSSKLYLLE
jgi:hypothetical protein